MNGPMTLDQQKVYFKSRIVAWQVRAATMCLAREQRDINKPPAEANAAWRAYGNIVFPRYNSELADNLQAWTTDMAILQRDMDPRQARELDRACAVTPGVEQ